MNEFELIGQLTRSLPANKSLVAGAGDDCAVLDLGLPDRLLLFKTDAVVEGTHFTASTPPDVDEAPALTGVNVLLAEDGLDNRRLLTAHLVRAADLELESRDGQWVWSEGHWRRK